MRPAPQSALLSAQSPQNLYSPAAEPRPTILRCVARPRRWSQPAGKHLIATAIEHEAVLVTLKALARRGWKTTLLPVGPTGIVEPQAWKTR